MYEPQMKTKMKMAIPSQNNRNTIHWKTTAIQTMNKSVEIAQTAVTVWKSNANEMRTATQKSMETTAKTTQ